MDELETIKQTGEIPQAMRCPCCKAKLADCECSIMTATGKRNSNTYWLCFKHHRKGEWTSGMAVKLPEGVTVADIEDNPYLLFNTVDLQAQAEDNEDE